jgi:hypothetical protein
VSRPLGTTRPIPHRGAARGACGAGRVRLWPLGRAASRAGRWGRVRQGVAVGVGCEVQLGSVGRRVRGAVTRYCPLGAAVRGCAALWRLGVGGRLGGVGAGVGASGGGVGGGERRGGDAVAERGRQLSSSPAEHTPHHSSSATARYLCALTES